MTPGPTKYASYQDVPFYRRVGFFALTWLVFAPLACVILVSGNVYYVRDGEVRGFAMVTRVVAGIFALLFFAFGDAVHAGSAKRTARAKRAAEDMSSLSATRSRSRSAAILTDRAALSATPPGRRG